MIKVWVTRDEEPDGPLCSALRDAGLVPVCEPVIARRVVGDARALIASLDPLDWLVLTSEFAIRVIPAEVVRCRVAVVGDSSRAAAERRGLRVALVSPDGTGESLWKTLRTAAAAARRVCYPRSSLAPTPPPTPELAVESPILYDTGPRRVAAAALAGVEVAALASPSVVPGVLEHAPGIRCATIGPTTSRALRARGVEPWVQAAEPTFVSLAAAIAGPKPGGLPATTAHSPWRRT